LLVVLVVHPDPTRRTALAAALREAGHAVVERGETAAPEGLVPDAVVAGPEVDASGLAASAPVVPDGADGAVLAALARVEAQQRTPLELSGARVDLRTGTVFRDGGAVPLTAREGALLAWLVGHAEHTVPREDLLVHVWGYRPTVVTRTVDVTVRRLREKIERDPSAPEHLRTVRGEGYRLELPATEAPSPAAVIGLVGRATDLDALEATVDESPVVTVLGPPGMGKTSLARALLARRDGTFADLVQASDRTGVLSAVTATLEIPAGLASVEAVGAGLARLPGRVIVLDNVEQVADPVAELVTAWRAQAPGVRFVLTSRLRVRLAEERVLELGPLAPEDATALLLARARERKPGWASEDPAPTASIAALLDGVPLALELAAARARVLGPSALLERLRRSFDLLADDRRDRTARQRTLRGAVQWSWDLLDPDERTALANLSVFRGGWDLEAAEAVLPLSEPAVLDTVEALVDHSLVQRRGARFDLLPWIRAFAADHLSDPAEARERHAAWFATWAARARCEVDGPRGWDALRALRVERGNIVAALEHALATTGPHLGDLAVALFPEWEVNRIPPAERGLLERALAHLDGPGEAVDAHWALVQLSDARPEQALRHAREAHEIAEAAGDDRLRVRALHALGRAHVQADAFEAAEEAFATALALPVEEPAIQIRILAEWGTALRRRGALREARARLEASLALAEAHQIAPLGSGARAMLASVLMLLRQHAAAETECRALIAAHREAGATGTVAVYTGLLGVNLYLSGRAEEGLAHLDTSLRLAREHGMGHLEGQDLLHHARANLVLGRFEAALDDARQAITVDRASGTTLDEVFATITLCEGLRELGDGAGCEGAIDRALALCREIGLHRGEVQAAQVLGLCRLQGGDLSGARAAFAVPLTEAPASPEEVRILGWIAVCDLEGAPGEARGTLDRALALAAALDHADTSLRGSLRCWRAAASFAAGDAAGARDDLRQAAPLLAPGWHAPAREALGWWRALFDPEPPESPRFTESRVARDLIRRLRAHIDGPLLA